MTKYIDSDGTIRDDICEDCQIAFMTPNNHNTLNRAYAHASHNDEASLTDQSFKEDADINTIVKRIINGQQVPTALPEHFGVDDRMTYLEMQERINESKSTFYNLAPEIRAEFLNDHARWADQVNRDLQMGNVENLQRMGIDINRKPPQEPSEPLQPEKTWVHKGEPVKLPLDPQKTETEK